MDEWALGRRIQLAPLSLSLCLSPFLSLALSASQGVAGHAGPLMPSNLLPNTHCRLSFKGLLTGMTSTSTPPSLPLSSPSRAVSPFLTSRYRSFCLLLKPSASLCPSLKLCLWMCGIPLLCLVYFRFPSFYHPFLFPFSFGLLSVTEIKSNAPLQCSLCLTHLPSIPPTVSSPR